MNELTWCVTCHDLFHSVPHCLNLQETISDNSVFNCQKCYVLTFPNLIDNETKMRGLFKIRYG